MINKKLFLISSIFLLALFLAPQISKASYYDYTDTLLIINDNSTISTAVGNYFLSARPTFPAGNVVHINAVTTETITRTNYNNTIKTPIETFITANGLHDTINYVILTKGVPIRITDTNNSVDSELAACLGKSTCSTSTQNAYYNANTIFSHLEYDIYIVTRLDGYAPGGDISQIRALIDHSSTANIASEATLKARSQFILDGGGSYNSMADPYLDNAKTLLNAKGWATVLDKTSTYLTSKTNVLGYWSWGSNANYSTTKPLNAIPGNTYENGAIGETAVSTSARSFAYPPSYGQSLITDWIAEGISGMKGYAAEPYMTAVAKPDILFDHYTDGFNLGDSYYAASEIIKWKDIVVGDPKTVIVYPAISATEILTFNLGNSSTPIVGVVNSSNHTVALTVPYGIAVTSLTPTITLSFGATISPSGAQDFTNPVTYTVTAMDGTTTQEYVVTVSTAPNTEAHISTFNFTTPLAAGIVYNSNHTVALTVPYGTTVTSLTPTITLSSGATISPSGAQDFTNPVTYTVTAMDGTTTQEYVVTVTDSANIEPFTILRSFLGVSDLAYPNGLLISGDKFYASSSSGGSSNYGTVYSINTDGTGLTILHNFIGGADDGQAPVGELILSGGKLYGITQVGGLGTPGSNNGYGVIYSINTDGSDFTILHRFTSLTDANDGAQPRAGLIISGDTLYGITNSGGNASPLLSLGTVFSIKTDGTNFTLLHKFVGGVSDGKNPRSKLILSGGKLYGGTVTGGASNFGTIYSVNTDGTGFTILYSFLGGVNNGKQIYDSLVISGDTLYGATPFGGSSDEGIVFSININGTGFTILHHYTASGTHAAGFKMYLILSESTLYVTAYSQDTNYFGTLFSINTNGTGYTLLHSFLGGASDGDQPNGYLVYSNSKLYGTTVRGGSSNYGTLYTYSFNTAPTLSGITASLDVVKGGSQIVITPVDPVDAENESLNFYVNETGLATSATNLCSQANASYATPYSDMTCSYNVPTGDGTRTVYARIFDGTDYSTEKTLTYIVDSTAPTLSFSSNVVAGPVTSNTVTATWGDATVKKWDYSTTNTCSLVSTDYTKTDSDSMNQTTEENNTKYICLYAEDAVGNSTTLASDYAINIDVTQPTSVSATLVADSNSQITATAQIATDTNGLAAAPYLFVRDNGLFSSSWQASNIYVDTGLASNTQYFYQVQTKDSLGNTSQYLDSIMSKYTLAPTPTNFLATQDGGKMVLTIDSIPNDTSDSSGYYFEHTNGNNSGWIQTNTWQDAEVSCGQHYNYTVKYRNGDGVVTSTTSIDASMGGCSPVPQKVQLPKKEETTTTNPTIVALQL